MQCILTFTSKQMSELATVPLHFEWFAQTSLLSNYLKNLCILILPENIELNIRLFHFDTRLELNVLSFFEHKQVSFVYNILLTVCMIWCSFSRLQEHLPVGFQMKWVFYRCCLPNAKSPQIKLFLIVLKKALQACL